MSSTRKRVAGENRRQERTKTGQTATLSARLEADATTQGDGIKLAGTG